MGERLFPPKKRDWKPGTAQIGLFYRTPGGSVIECIKPIATTLDERLLTIALAASARLSPKFVEALHAEYKRLTEKSDAR